MTKKIYSTVKLPEESYKKIQNEGYKFLMHNRLDTPSEEEIIENSKDADVIISAVNVNITKNIIDNSNNLKLISNVGAGTNNIDVKSAKANKIKITNTPSRDSVASTAEHALGLMLALSRNYLKNQNLVENNNFNGWQVMGFLGGNQVSYKKLLIIGFGNIGQEIADMAKAFKMDIYYYNHGDLNRFRDAESKTGAKFIELEEGLKMADYIILQMNYTDDNFHFIDKKEIDLMKKSAYLINTARGKIVNEEALADALDNNQIRGVAIDTHEDEPKFNERLKKMDNVILTPHIGNDTYEARLEMANVAVDQAIKFLKGEELDFEV